MRPSAVVKAAVGVLLAWVLSCLPGAHGRGAGTDYYLLSKEGRLIAQLDGKAHVDPEAELLFHLKDGKITATRFTGKEPVWSAPYPAEGRTIWFVEVPGVLVLVTEQAVHGYDKANGKSLYRTPVGNFRLFLPFHPHGEWGPGTDLESRSFLYLADDGLEDERPARPKALARIDLRTGKRLWERALSDEYQRMEIATVAPGEVTGRDSSAYYFDPRTGEPLPKDLNDPKKTRQVLFHGDLFFRLSADKAATLAAHEQGTHKELWAIKGLEGVERILTGPAHDRLLCATATDTLVLDTKRQRALCRLPAADPTLSVFQAENLVIVETPRTRKVTAFGPASGKALWARQAREGWTACLAADEVVVVEPAAKKEPQHRKDRDLVVLALALKDGGVRWQWRVPDLGHFFDSQWARVVPCKSGFVVKREWIILD